MEQLGAQVNYLIGRPGCGRCGGNGVYATAFTPSRIINGRIVDAWHQPCGCNTLADEDFVRGLIASRPDKEAK